MGSNERCMAVVGLVLTARKWRHPAPGANAFPVGVRSSGMDRRNDRLDRPTNGREPSETFHPVQATLQPSIPSVHPPACGPLLPARRTFPVT